jgi:hypothetical protein
LSLCPLQHSSIERFDKAVNEQPEGAPATRQLRDALFQLALECGLNDLPTIQLLAPTDSLLRTPELKTLTGLAGFLRNTPNWQAAATWARIELANNQQRAEIRERLSDDLGM